MAIQNYKKFINKRQNNELTDITPDFGELVVGKDRVIIGLGDNTIYNTKEKELELERLQYYGDKNIVPSDESYFTVNSTGETITGLTDTGKTQSGTLVIPYKINGKIITTLKTNNIKSILDGATDQISKVILPNSITNIVNMVFAECTSLTEIEIPNSVTNIGGVAFYKCTSLTKIEIPDSVTNIGSNAFASCSSLTSINISNSVTNIGSNAFGGCSSLTSIELPNSITSIDAATFSSCTSLELIKIPNSVTSINNNVFNGITPSNLTVYCEQGSYAETYAQEKGYNIVYTDVSDIATSEELERLQYYGDKNIVPSDKSWFTVNATGETITGLTDTGKAQSGTLIIPYKINGVEITTIGDNAFYSCTSLTSINIPNSVTSIGMDVFFSCESLTSINIPNSVTSIGMDAFLNCKSLTSINIPNSVISIGKYAFCNCESLESINLSNSLTGISIATFSGCTSLTSINIPNNITSIAAGTFNGCTSLTSINIPNSVTNIDEAAFAGITPANLTVYCKQDSYPETYAQAHEFNIVYTDVSKTAFDSKADNIDIDTLKKLSVPHTTASGYPVSVSDHLEGESVIDYKVYGNSTQDGTPTPEVPIEIQSVGDLVTDETSEYYGKYDISVSINDETKHIYLDKPLRKVGDYADYIDWGNQVVVRNVYASKLSGFTYTIENESASNNLFRTGYFMPTGTILMKAGTALLGYCNVLPSNTNVTTGWTKPTQESIRFGQSNNAIYVYAANTYSSKEELLNYLGNDAYVVYPLATPTTEPITVPDFDVPNSEGMNISSSTIIPPSSIDLTYYQDINRVITELKNAILAQGGNV